MIRDEDDDDDDVGVVDLAGICSRSVCDGDGDDDGDEDGVGLVALSALFRKIFRNLCEAPGDDEDTADAVLFLSNCQLFSDRFSSVYATLLFVVPMRLMVIALLSSHHQPYEPEFQTFVGGPEGCALITSSRHGPSGGRFCSTRHL